MQSAATGACLTVDGVMTGKYDFFFTLVSSEFSDSFSVAKVTEQTPEVGCLYHRRCGSGRYRSVKTERGCRCDP
jgi:hypothetical protein